MSIPRFAIMNSARRMNKPQVPEQTNENDIPKSQYSSNIPTFSSTSMHPYEVQMFTKTSTEIWKAEKQKNADPFSSGNISEVLKRNEYIIPKGWTEEQLLGTKSNGWQSPR